VAEAAGCTGVVVPERRSAEVTPAVCRASAGAVEHLPVARVRNLADWLGDAKRHDAWVYGAAAEAKVPYDQPDYGGRVVLVLGSEGRGLRPRVAESCDELVKLPNRGKVGSLNVSTAAAALVYGILHFRRGA
jgi:23S rRNA (guanosine2251-2'-O)-methyltransferase